MNIKSANGAFTVLLGIGAIYAFDQYNLIVGAILLAWFVLRLSGLQLNTVIQKVSAIFKNNELETRTNCQLSIKINVEEVIKSQPVKELHQRMSKVKDADFKISYSNWVNKLMKNYSSETDEERKIEEVKFNIKNGNLWKNEAIDFYDVIFHDFLIPLDTDKKRSREDIHVYAYGGLTIRLTLVNGILKLQIGKMGKEITSNLMHDHSLMAVYERYETISEFPLIYFHSAHCLPEKFLNVDFTKTPSYKKRMLARDKSIDARKDVKVLQEDLSAYRYLCSADDDNYDHNKWSTADKEFKEKRELILEKNGFKDMNNWSNDDGLVWQDYSAGREDYSNTFLSIGIYNLNEIKEMRDKYYYSDYYEESPV